MSSPSTEEGLTAGTSGWLEDHMDIIKKRIIRDASEGAKLEGRNIEPKDVAEAAKRFAPGFEIGPESARVTMAKSYPVVDSIAYFGIGSSCRSLRCFRLERQYPKRV